jgi:hypothetical protein
MGHRNYEGSNELLSIHLQERKREKANGAALLGRVAVYRTRMRSGRLTAKKKKRAIQRRTSRGKKRCEANVLARGMPLVAVPAGTTCGVGAYRSPRKLDVIIN